MLARVLRRKSSVACCTSIRLGRAFIGYPYSTVGLRAESLRNESKPVGFKKLKDRSDTSQTLAAVAVALPTMAGAA